MRNTIESNKHPMKIFSILLPVLFIASNLYCQISIDTSNQKMMTMQQVENRLDGNDWAFFEPNSDKRYTGILYGRYNNGNLLTMQEYVDGKGNGTWIDFDPEGRMIRKGTYKNNKVEGPVTEYYENGNVKSIGQYLHWKNPIGEWIYYDEQGNIAHKMTYTR